MKWLFLQVAAVLVTGCAVMNPATVEIVPNGEKSLIVVEIDSIPKEASLIFQTFDEGTRQLVLRYKPPGGTFMSEKYSRSGKYMYAPAYPGRYVLSSVSLQLNWVLCLNDQTSSFEIKPGEVLFLGRFNPKPQLTKLISLSTGSISINGQKFYMFDKGVPPVFEPPASADIEALKLHLKENSPKVSAPVRAGDTKNVQFETGTDMLRTQRVCGGYY